jgi:hypothetical chaperone protein
VYCAIDFGTSNSGIAVAAPGGAVQLLEIEAGRPTMPTAVFYAVEGRLMRSMKSILGSTLVERRTELGAGHSVAYLDVVADIGGGTSDFSLVRVGPQRRARAERRDDILANHGVHAAGTDFDRHIELACILPACGYRSLGPSQRGQRAREVPNAVYFDLATWHLINTVYTPQRVFELATMREFYGDVRLYERLMTVVKQRLGHALAAQAEQAKIEVADGEPMRVALDAVEPGLAVALKHELAMGAVHVDLDHIVLAARETLRQAGVAEGAVDVLYLTGGSTGLAPLAQRLAAVCPSARVVRGDRFASVVQGLGLHAQRTFR